MKHLPNTTATKALLFCVLLFSGSLAWAGTVAGVVKQLSGPLFAKKADGRMKVLALKSEVEEGDTLVSEKNTYALVKLIDNSEITLRPNSSFTIDRFAYDAAKPQRDSASFTLVKGGLRSVTGLLGKRSKDKWSLKTPTATIGIRGTTFTAEWIPPGLENAQSRVPGLYVTVIEGRINVANDAGNLDFAAGQAGHIPSAVVPPAVLARLPSGLDFTPPPGFTMDDGGPELPGAAKPPKPAECEVR